MNWMIRWMPAVVWMALIFYMSHQTGDDLGTMLPFFQKWFPSMLSFDWGHFLAYFVLGLTYYAAMYPRWSTWGGKVLVVLLCLLYGVTDEFHQQFVEDRTPDLLDLRNDTIGALIAMLFVSVPFVNRLFRKLYKLN